MNLFRAIDGQEHRRDPAVGNELGFGLTDDVRVRQHHRIVTDTMFIGPCNELFGERSHLVESERRIATVPLDFQALKRILLVLELDERHDRIHNAIVHLALDAVVPLLVAVRATEIAHIGGNEAER